MVANNCYTETSDIALRYFSFYLPKASNYLYLNIVLNNKYIGSYGNNRSIPTPTHINLCLILKKGDLIKIETQTAEISTTNVYLHAI